MKTDKTRVIRVLGMEKLMREQGLTEIELSARTGITQAYINRLKKGHITPRVDTAKRVSSALRSNIEDTFLRHFQIRVAA